MPRGELVYVAGVGPGGKPGDDVELPEEFADDLVGVSLGAQQIELSHDFQEGLLNVLDRPLRVVLPLLLQALLALQEFFAIEIGNRIENRLAMGTRIGQETKQAVP